MFRYNKTCVTPPVIGRMMHANEWTQSVLHNFSLLPLHRKARLRFLFVLKLYYENGTKEKLCSSSA